MRCIEVLEPPPREFLLGGATLSEFLLARASTLSSSFSSLPPPDFLMKGRFIDSLRERGLFSSCTSSDTELEAISFWRAANFSILISTLRNCHPFILFPFTLLSPIIAALPLLQFMCKHIRFLLANRVLKVSYIQCLHHLLSNPATTSIIESKGLWLCDRIAVEATYGLD